MLNEASQYMGLILKRKASTKEIGQSISIQWGKGRTSWWRRKPTCRNRIRDWLIWECCVRQPALKSLGMGLLGSGKSAFSVVSVIIVRHAAFTFGCVDEDSLHRCDGFDSPFYDSIDVDRNRKEIFLFLYWLDNRLDLRRISNDRLVHCEIAVHISHFVYFRSD